MKKQILSFGVIGVIGFLVDAAILLLCNSILNIDLILSRIVSFSIAVTVTWYLNRNLTFKKNTERHFAKEWISYVIFNSIGALANLAIFTWLVLRYEYLSSYPIIALAIASGFAMIINFIASKYMVFKERNFKYDV